MKINRRLPLLLAALGVTFVLVAAAAVCVRAWHRPARLADPADSRPTLLITGATSGNMEPCNCPGQPRGGLSRRQTVLNRLRARFVNTVLLDTGNLLQLDPDPILDRYSFVGFARLGYDAVGVGDQELDRGGTRLAELLAAGKLPFVAANVSTTAVELGPRYRIVERGGRRILVIGVVGPRMLMFSRPQIAEQFTVGEPAAAVAGVLAEVNADPGRRCDLVVVLAVLEPGERKEVVPRLMSADLVILSTEQERPVAVEMFGDVPAIYAPTRGQQVAAVVWDDFAPGRRPRIAEVRAEPVEMKLPRDKPLWELYQAYTYDAQQAALAKEGKAGKVHFAAAAACNPCHAEQYLYWARHKHGQAWATIVKEGRTLDPQCMRCHTAGYGFQTGFRSGDLTPQLANVGCQECHQAVDWPAHEKAKAPMNLAKVDDAVCEKCHTDANSPDFDIDEYKPKATCPKRAPTTAPGKE